MFRSLLVIYAIGKIILESLLYFSQRKEVLKRCKKIKNKKKVCNGLKCSFKACCLVRRFQKWTHITGWIKKSSSFQCPVQSPWNKVHIGLF